MLAFLVIALIAGSTNFAVIGNALSDNTWQYPIATVIAIAAAFFAVFIEMGKIPFDLAEAEQELQEGPLTEYFWSSTRLIKNRLKFKIYGCGIYLCERVASFRYPDRDEPKCGHF